MTEPSVAPITDALLTALATAMGVPVGSGQKPPGAVPPYGFLTRINLMWTGPLGDPWHEAELTYQLQCIALDHTVVELLEDKAAPVFAALAAPAGWAIVGAHPLGSPGIRLDKDEHPEVPLFYSTPQWQVWAQPTA